MTERTDQVDKLDDLHRKIKQQSYKHGYWDGMFMCFMITALITDCFFVWWVQ